MDAFRIVLMRPSHPGNIGAVARAMRVMGLHRLVVVDPRETGFAAHPEAVAFASGAQVVLESARAVPTLEAAVADCQRVIGVSAEARAFSAQPSAPEPLLDACLHEWQTGEIDSIALVFGTERTGLSIAELARCDRLVSIPADPTYSSLNLSQAVQVLAYCIRQRVLLLAPSAAGVPREPSARERLQGEVLASHEAREALYAHLERALIRLEFLDPAVPRQLMPRMRRLFGRADLQQSEVDLLRGICTRIERMVAAPD